jgi:hypothetical protein
MQLKYVKIALAVVWVVGVMTIGMFAHVTSIGGWISLVALAVLPPVVIARIWKGPEQTMSESIQQARR